MKESAARSATRAFRVLELLDEKKQQIEDLGLHRNPNPVPSQLAKLTVKFMIFKAKSQAPTARHGYTGS